MANESATARIDTGNGFSISALFPPEDPARCALEMVLLFHSPSPWTEEKSVAWSARAGRIAKAAGRDPGIYSCTTAVLCEAARIALGAPGTAARTEG